jgi:putative oxidoreductase
VSLWIAQILLAGMFGMVGFMKIATPIAVLAQKMAWVTGAPALVRFIGICELAGAIGLILPAAFKIMPKLAGFAATGLLAIMVLAVPFTFTGEKLRSSPCRSCWACWLPLLPGAFPSRSDSGTRMNKVP